MSRHRLLQEASSPQELALPGPQVPIGALHQLAASALQGQRFEQPPLLQQRYGAKGEAWKEFDFSEIDPDEVSQEERDTLATEAQRLGWKAGRRNHKPNYK